MSEKTTEKQLQANRRNARLSTGPKTPEGKNRVRWNALKHGLLARSIVVPANGSPENRTQFFYLLAQLHQQLQPVGILEEMLVEQIAVAYWRLRRALKAESGEIGEQLEDWKKLQNTAVFSDQNPSERRFHTGSLALPLGYAAKNIRRYEAAIHRQLRQAIEQLQHLPKQRQQHRPSADYPSPEA
jgi:hypothetical protein